MSHDDDHEIHLLYFLMTQESGHDSFFMCDVSLDILYILYISFHSIFMWQSVYLMLLLLYMFQKLKKDAYFCIFLSLPIYCRCFGDFYEMMFSGPQRFFR
jgi:hypothetical protein